jgi:hypothetical protein
MNTKRKQKPSQKLSEQERFPHPQSVLNRILKAFWSDFRATQDADAKRLLLFGSTKKRVPDWEQFRDQRRQKFRTLRLRPEGPCAVCGEPAQVLHHIVMLKHGGTNDRKNLIDLCDSCHSGVHPWIADALEEPLVDEHAAAHMRAILD